MITISLARKLIAISSRFFCFVLWTRFSLHVDVNNTRACLISIREIATHRKFHSRSISNPLEEIDIQLKNRLDRKRSVDTTSGGSNVTVIEGNNLPADDGGNAEESSDNAKQSCVEEAVQAAPSLPSCLIRQGSIRTSIKKKVRCSDAAEVIPVQEYLDYDDNQMTHEDDDDVFSDTAPVQTPRGNMCTPYIERKGSLPGLDALPDWFPNSRLFPIFPIFCIIYDHNLFSMFSVPPI